MADKTKAASNGALGLGIGALGLSTIPDLPADITGVSEPVGLILALIGAIIKLVQFYKAKK
jgi:hypothetical protein